MKVVHKDNLQPAIDALLAGEVVAIPTDTVYGVAVATTVTGAATTATSAADKIFEAKKRPRNVVLPVLVADIEQCKTIATNIGEVEQRWMTKFWPGDLTIVLDRAPTFTADLGEGANEATVGIRCPANEIARKLCKAVGPLATTSANLHGEAPAQSVDDVIAAFDGRIAAVVDGGASAGEPSTVARWAAGEPQVLRQGSISADQLILVAQNG